MTTEWIRSQHLVQKLLLLCIVYSALLIFIAPSISGIVSRWFKFDESYSHGLLLLAVSIALVARKAKDRPLYIGFYPLWLIPFTLALLAYSLGEILRLQALQEITVVPLLLGALAILVGWKQVKPYILPIGVLTFAIPVWDYLSWTLQILTVAINQVLLGLVDIDFEIEGVFVYLTGVGVFEVAHGCSGLRYLLVAQSLALIYGELNLRQVSSRVLLFLAAVLFGLLANWIRVFVIIYIGHETNMQSSLINNHDNFGWWVFAATLVPLFLLGRRLERRQVEQSSKTIDSSTTCDQRMMLIWSGALLTAVLPIAMLILLPSSGGKIKPVPESFDIRLNSERYAPLFGKRLGAWSPKIRNPDFVFAQTFFDRRMATESVAPDEHLFIGVYGYEYQRHRAELVQYSNRIYDKGDWIPEQFYKIKTPSEISLQGVTLKNLVSENRIHVAYSYYVAGRWETDQWKAKLAPVVSLFDNRRDATLLIFGVSCEDCSGKDSLTSLVKDVMPTIVEQVTERFE